MLNILYAVVVLVYLQWFWRNFASYFWRSSAVLVM